MKKIDFKERFGGAQLEKWRSTYGNLYGYTSSDGKAAILRAPDIKILDACSVGSHGSDIEFDRLLLLNCWLAGDEALKTEAKYILGVRDWLGNIIEKVYGEMVEL
jgi:hypothetical protein